VPSRAPDLVTPAAPARAPWRDAPLPAPIAVVAGLLLVLAFGAFWPMYLSKPFVALDRYTHAHAAIGLAWMLLLVAQPLAIRRGRPALHRVLGRVAVVVAPAFVISGVLLAHFRFAAMDEQALLKEAFFLYLPLHTAVLFALAAGLGFHYRRATALHARFMGATALLLVDPVVVRLLVFYLPALPGPTTYQVITFGLADVAFVALVLWFRPKAVDARPLWLFFGAMLTAHALWFTLAQTPAWLAFARWFRALPLT
jgi:uncharacterized membrane protein